MRDNFSAKTVRILRTRVGHRCSNPDCRRATTGPAFEEDRTITIGVAAHIAAASEGGPRYDKALTREARKSANNGIWLCQNCSKLIDSDTARYSPDVLQSWKQQAVGRAFKAIATSAPEESVATLSRFEADEADQVFIGSLGLPTEDTIEAVTVRLLQAAANDVATFRSTREWPMHAIALNLTLTGTEARSPVTLDGIAKAIGVADGVSLVSPPGTGKSTTLVQLAERIVSARQFVPLIVPLGEWSDRADDFFDFVSRRNAFGAFRRQHFMQMAYHGRLALLLDGWNELDPNGRTSAIHQLSALRRDYPQLVTVIGTRPYALPIEGAVIEIERLSDDQQLEIARAQRGSEGEALVDQAWRSPGVRELIAIPLYLNALLATPSGSPFPKTKEEVLRSFVMTHEQAAESAEILRRALHGFHRDMLVGLASQANRSANTFIQETTARQVIAAVGKQLLEEGQLTIPLQPTTAIDVLIGSHILVRPASGAGAIMFQHQQFQEWYASYEVERLMVETTSGNAETLKVLREGVLNWPAWEESILFACERLSRQDEAGVAAVAKAIDEALGIDPILAAEMIYRSAHHVWPMVRGRVTALVHRWHVRGKVDRAVRFMIASGRPEFAELVWPLVSSEDDQVHLHALRAAARFHPTVLGDDAAAKLASLTEKTRKHVISEIASNGGYDGMELAANLAKTDPNPTVVVAILQSLQFRRADWHVTEILRTASEGVWQQMAREGYPDTIADERLQQRLLEQRKVAAASKSNPLQSLDALTSGKSGAADAAERAAEIIRSKDFPLNSADGGHAFDRAYEAYSKQVTEALVFRIAEGLEVPYRAREYLGGVPVVENGPIAATALSDAAPERIRNAALAMVGPNTVARLMDEFFALHDEYVTKDWQIDESERKKYYRVENAILVTREESFLDGLLERAGIDEPKRIRLMAKLLGLHGGGVTRERFVLNKERGDRLAAIMNGWVGVLLTSPDATRHDMSDVVSALQRIDASQFVPKLKQMLDRDLSDHARAREEYLQSPGGSVSPDVSYSYSNCYQDTFASIGGDEVVTLMKGYLPTLQFGVEAARVLAILWDHEHPSGKEKQWSSWNDFSEVGERRKQLDDPQNPPRTCDFAEAIFATVQKVATEAQSDEERRHAIALAQIGLGIPHGSKRAVIDGLLQLPLPHASKQALLTGVARAGETIDVAMLLAGLRELLEAGKVSMWRLDESRGELMGWIELFAFSDRPNAVVEALDLLPPACRNPWALRRLLEALAHSPHADALHALEELARCDSRFLKEYEWLNAMIKLGTEAVGFALLEHVCNSSLAVGSEGVDLWHMANCLEGFARKFPTFREELARRYTGIRVGLSQEILERALAKVADGRIILAMIASYATTGRTFRQDNLREAIENVAVGRRPAGDWPGAFEEFSVSLKALRKELFGLVLARNDQSLLAEACLNYVDELRDEHGRIPDEPRHPDIGSGKAWPLAIPA